MFDHIAIVGATGAVGQLIRNMLEEREFPHEKITFLASARSAGSTIEFNGKKHTVKELKPEAFEGIDLAIGSTPDPVAKDFVPWAKDRGCVVVDGYGNFRVVGCRVAKITADANHSLTSFKWNQTDNRHVIAVIERNEFLHGFLRQMAQGREIPVHDGLFRM